MGIFGLNFKRKAPEPEIDPILEAAIKARLAERVRSVNRSRRPLRATIIRENGRDSDRARVYRVGSAMFSPEHETSCRIVDQSFSGLRLAFNGDAHCPDEFALTIPTLRFIGIVRKIWQNDAEVGVSIVRWNDAA